MNETERSMKDLQTKIMANIEARNGTGKETDMTTMPPRVATGPRIAERLERHFGLGSDEERRRKLFERLEYEVEEYGDPVYTIINDCLQGSLAARKPSHWFCKSVILRLKEAGYLSAVNHVEW